MAGNGSTTISERSKMTLGMFLALLGLILTAAGGWFTVAVQAREGLPRAEAYSAFVTKADYTTDQEEICRRLTRIEDKLDRLSERVK
jgi:hypothetical protein